MAVVTRPWRWLMASSEDLMRTKLPMILQEQVSECAHACVAMVACFWGHDLDLGYLRRRSPTSIRGVNLHQVNQLFGELGFETRALRVPMEELALVTCPALLHWNMNHFVVLKKVTRTHFVIHDPAMGVRRLTHAEVSKCFTGIVLEVSKPPLFQPILARHSLNGWSWLKSVENFKRWLGLLMLLSLVIEMLTLAAPLFTQYVTDHVIGSADFENLKVAVLGFLVIIMGLVLSERLRAHLVLYLKMRMTEQFSVQVMRHLLRLPLTFFESRHKGDLQSKINAIGEIQRKFSIDLVTTFLDGVMVVLQAILMLIYSVPLTILVLISFSFEMGVRLLSYRSLQDQMNSAMHHHAKAATVFLESLQSIVSIKAYLKEAFRLTRWRTHFTEGLNQDLCVARLHIRYQFVHQCVTQVEYLAVLTCGAWMVMHQTLSVGMLLAFLGFRQQWVQKCASLMHQFFEYRVVGLHLERLNDVISHPTEPIEGQQKRGRIALKGEIALQEVSFTYHPSLPPLFSGMTVHIKAGEKVALVGPSGCGKTTLLKVMMGLLEPSDGKVLIDGFCLHDLGLKNYRQAVASVMQEDALLSGSLLENITFFDEEVDLEYLHYVAKLAAISHFIERLPMGYETRLGDMGSSLSGGQKQRILLARALYKKPKILFLDEATSHLDAKHEAEINQALKTLNITQVIVAHRQETIAMADRVISIEKNSI